MIGSLCKTINSFILKVILSIIIMSVILTSMSSYLINDSGNYAAKVNGKKISISQLENTLASEQDRIQQQLDDQFSELMVNEDYVKLLRQKTLNFLIDEVLLGQYTKQLGLEISDEQVKNAIFATKAFQIDGRFNNDRYNNVVINQMGMSIEQYIQILRNQLTMQQLINAITDTEFMLKYEADKMIKLITQRRIVREITIDVNALASKLQVSDDEVKMYYEQNKTSFMTPKQFRISYIKLDADTISEIASENEIQSYYDQNLDQFTQMQRNRYSVIQTKTETDAKSVMEELKNNVNFAAVAKIKSIDVFSAKNGGDIGWFEERSIPEEIKNANLKDKGQLSGIIESTVGFLIARLDDIQPAKTKLLTEVYDDVATKVKQKKALSTYYSLLQKVSNAINNDDKSLMNAEEIVGIKAIETNWFSYNNLPQELNFKPVVNAIFNGTLINKNGLPSNNSYIITMNNNCSFILRINGYKSEVIKPLDIVKNHIVELVKYNKAEQQVKLDIEKLLTKLECGKGEEVLKRNGLSFGPTKVLNRNDHDPISQAAFNLRLPVKNKSSYGIVSDMQGNIVLLALDEVKAGIISKDQEKELMQSIMQDNIQIMFEVLMNSLRKEAKIKIGDLIT